MSGSVLPHSQSETVRAEKPNNSPSFCCESFFICLYILKLLPNDFICLNFSGKSAKNVDSENPIYNHIIVLIYTNFLKEKQVNMKDIQNTFWLKNNRKDIQLLNVFFLSNMATRTTPLACSFWFQSR